MFASIRNGQPLNYGEKLAHSTMVGIMGRMAAYTGKTITWEQALNSTEVLAPEGTADLGHEAARCRRSPCPAGRNSSNAAHPSAMNRRTFLQTTGAALAATAFAPLASAQDAAAKKRPLKKAVNLGMVKGGPGASVADRFKMIARRGLRRHRTQPARRRTDRGHPAAGQGGERTRNRRDHLHAALDIPAQRSRSRRTASAPSAGCNSRSSKAANSAARACCSCRAW